MARPIEATPTLKGKDADKLFLEAEKPISISPTKKEEMDKCVELYQKFSAQRQKNPSKDSS